jgi:hypothetical protein
MTDTQAICISSLILALILYAGWCRLIGVLRQAVKEFDLDEVEVIGRTVKVKGKK